MRSRNVFLAVSIFLSMATASPTSGEGKERAVSLSQTRVPDRPGQKDDTEREYFPQDFHVHIAAISDAKDSVEWFVAYLKKFVYGTGFADGAFELYAEALTENLAGITQSVQQLAPDKEAAKMLEYAQHMFSVMVECLALLREYNSGVSRTNRVVSGVFRLTASLLSLRNAHGAPDHESPNYAGLLENFKHDLHISENEVSKLRKLEGPLRDIIQQQLLDARNTIAELEQYIAK